MNPANSQRAAVLILGALAWAIAPGQDRNTEARETARAVGADGQATARNLATDPTQALAVPGFEGADVAETGHTAANLENAARAALADPTHTGGAVGAFVTESTATRPAANVRTDDPDIQRGEAVQAAPAAPVWRAQGLTSGTVRDCGRNLDTAGTGGNCGGVNWCVGAGCERVDTPANTGFVSAATRLNMVFEMGGDEFDRQTMRIFSGEHRACPVRLLGAQNCCNDSGLLIEIGLADCTAEEIELAEARAAGVTHYLGEYCAKRILGICRRRDRAWCVFTSRLGRIFHQQARPQLGIGWSHCDGFTVQQIERIDFDRVNLSEFTASLLDPGQAPGVVLPNADATGAAMENRIRVYFQTR